jgi:hypothetical protein
MFFPGSRYESAETYQTAGPDGRPVSVVKCRLPAPAPLRGFHRRAAGHRLDLIASRYAGDPAAFWKLCDASGAVAPDALGARELVGIPADGS